MNDTFTPSSQQEWREWLEKNHDSAKSIWLIYYKKNTGKPSLDWSQAVDEALCFGWIDSTRRSLDEERFQQYFCKRKPNSTWSKVNKTNVERLIKEGKMTEAGLNSIRIAKENGSWSFLDSIDALEIPIDLKDALNKHKGAFDFFNELKKTIKRGMLYWIKTAKRQETRMKRIAEIVEHAAKNEIPKRFQY